MRATSPRSVLLLCDDDPSLAGNVHDHLQAFQKSHHAVSLMNPRGLARARELDLDEFDVVVIHYTIVVSYNTYLPAELAEKIADFNGLKIQFIQDEYRWVDEITDTIRRLGIDVLYTLVPEDALAAVYGSRLPDTQLITTLAGFVPDELPQRVGKPASKRPIDVGYRGRHVPYWLGSLGQDKIEIGHRFLEHPKTQSLKLDISWTESDRMYGEAWIDFLMRCRTTLGTESGASIVDFTGEIENTVTAYMAAHPAATFDEVHAKLLAPHEGNAVINVVSPRIFEAAALRTGLVLFPGEYSGVVAPWEHYVPLARDLSNIDEVVAAIRDDDFVDAMVDRAFTALVETGDYSLSRFIQSFDLLVDERAPLRAERPKTTFLQVSQRRRREATGLTISRRLRARAKHLAGEYAVLRSKETRRLRGAYRRSPQARALVSERRFNEDLRKLAMLAGLQQNRLKSRLPLVIDPIVSGDRLVLAARERTTQSVSDARAHAQEALQLLREGSVHEVSWHHMSLGSSVVLNLARGALAVPMEVGYYGLNGVHRFTGLERLERSLRSHVITAYQAAMAPAADLSGREFRRKAPPLPGVIGAAFTLMARDPGRYARQTSVALKFAAHNPPVRALLRAYGRRREIRAAINPLELLDDILKLAMLERVANDTSSQTLARRAGLEILRDGHSLRIRTVPTGAPHLRIPEDGPRVTEMVWDHSAFGGTLMVDPHTSTTFDDPGGTHNFRALAAACTYVGSDLGQVLRAVLLADSANGSSR